MKKLILYKSLSVKTIVFFIIMFSISTVTFSKNNELNTVQGEEKIVYQNINKSIALKDSFVYVAADTTYRGNAKKSFWMGQNYREVWTTPIKARVFDIEKEKGGLTILKQGGGMQTLSLRLENSEGRQYVLRSIRKNVEGALPAELKNTLAIDIVQDIISASNPYASIVVAKLAEFAGVFHTNPEIVYVPDDSRFGEYRKIVANQLFIFEERPNGNWENEKSFGWSEKIVSTAEVVTKTKNSSNYQIDEHAVLRARLFDIVINDWDRHDDQWRWASFKKGKTTIYKPIPRDRDQAFFVNQGVIPWIASRKWLMPKIQNFDTETKNVEGLSFNARFFDRSFLTNNNWEDWLAEIDVLKNSLSKEKIYEAVKLFPADVHSFCIDCTTEILLSRLNNLESMAQKLFLSLSEEVAIPGTEKKDKFKLKVKNNSVNVSISSGKKDDRNRFFHRTFSYPETKEIKLFGMDGKDDFIISGSKNNKINIRIIGGNGDDKIQIDNEIPRKLFVYDKESTDTKNYPSRKITGHFNSKALEYNRLGYKNDLTRFTLKAGYNVDDGILLGGGPIFTRHRQFRDSQQSIFANFSLSTRSSNFKYEGIFKYPIKDIEFHILTDIKAPNYSLNYFGLGNETQWRVSKRDKNYYRLRVKQYHLKAGIHKILNNEKNKIGLSLDYKNSEVDKTPGRFITDLENNGLKETDFLNTHYAGGSLMYDFNNLNNSNKQKAESTEDKMFPTHGQRLHLEYNQFFGLKNVNTNFGRLSAEWSGYFSFSAHPKVVYAFRAGAIKNIGEYQFYEAVKLGGSTNLRGFRTSRFYGDAAVYQNTEIRFRLGNFKSYLVNGSAGLLVFNDLGRVFLKNETSKKWHDGYGAGLWLAPFEMVVFNVSYAMSSDDAMVQLGLHYRF